MKGAEADENECDGRKLGGAHPEIRRAANAATIESPSSTATGPGSSPTFYVGGALAAMPRPRCSPL